jgi:2-oxoisovalerate dehydrogenase E2 component (dihydrolipoyl transacylase)
MPTSIAMPQLGESVTEGTVGRWLKAVGDRIEKDEPLVEIVTDKVNVEVPSPEAGYLVRIAVDEGQTVAVGTEIAMLDSQPGAAAPSGPGSDAAAKAAPAATSTSATIPPPSAPTVAASAASEMGNAPIDAPGAPAPKAASGGAAQQAAPAATAVADPDDLPRTSPLVRRLAREHGVSLADIQGSGLGGRVTRDDVVAFLEKKGITPTIGPVNGSNGAPSHAPVAAAPAAARLSDGPATTPGTAPSAPAAASGGDSWRPLTPMRRAIADHMVRSVSTAPHVTMTFEIDATGIARHRETAQADFRGREGFELTYLPFFAKALCDSLREHPILNARFKSGDDGGQGILLHGQIHLGVAVGLEAGLVVPVIRNADGLSIAGLARAIRDVATRARASRLTLDDMRGGTFTLNNTGAFGSVKSNPIINDGQAAILTMEAVVRRPVVVNRDGEEAIVVRSIMTSCLTFDHRVLDGLQAGRFMQSLKRRIEAIGPDTAL